MRYTHTSPSSRPGRRPPLLWLPGLAPLLDWLARVWQFSTLWRMSAAFGLPFILYTLTLAPTIYNLDSAELTTAAATGGLMRATGYPLYLFLGRLWANLPVGDVGYRMNMFSAFTGALTLLFVERILSRLSVGNWASLFAVGLLAAAPFFWSLSLVAEVYTLHTALMGLLILLLINWAQHPTLARLGAVTGLIGLSLGHHLATSLLIPGALGYILLTHPHRALAPRGILIAILGGLAGLSIYLVLPLRYFSDPAFNYAGIFDAAGQFHPVNLASPSGLWWLVTGKSFAAQMFAYHGGELWKEIVWFAGHLTRAFFVVGIGPAFLGLVVLARQNWKLAGMLFLMFGFSAFFYVDYRVLDKESMFLPTYVIWAVWLGLGVQCLLDWVKQEAGAANLWPARFIQGAIGVSVLAALLVTGPQVDLSDDWSTRIRGEAILEEVEPHALVLGWWDTVPVVQYLQLVEGQRPDVQAINRFLITMDDLTLLVKREIVSRPVYINELPLSWQNTFTAKKTGPLYQIFLRPEGD